MELLDSNLKNRKRVIRIITTCLILSNTAAKADPNIMQEISLWREHIIKKEKYVLKEADYYNEASVNLAKRGPNILPDLFAAYEGEKDPNVLYCYEGLISRIGHFRFYRYSTKPLMHGGKNYQCLDTNNLPFLNMEVGENRLSVLPQVEAIKYKRDKLVQWWSQHNSFTKRIDALEKIRAVTGRQKEQVLALDNVKKREFNKFEVFGIYNIPYYIDAIEQDNNPAVLVEFLRVGNNPEYSRLFQMHYDLAAFAHIADSAYPEKSQKIALVYDWWSENKEKFSNLSDLYNEINQRVEKLCPTK